MHLLVREAHTLDDASAACDLDQAPGDLVFLSFSDSDLAVAASAWRGMAPSLRLANLAQLRHPMSVDLYLEKTLRFARCAVIRLLGGLNYWRYGAEEVASLCRAGGIACAIVPGDDRADPRLAALSTVAADDLDRLASYFRFGGEENLRHALAFASRLAGLDVAAPALPRPLPAAGWFEAAERGRPGEPVAAVVFYRSHLLAGDTAPITALADALAARGLAVRALYADSLKGAAAGRFVAECLRALRPAVVISTMGFSARQDEDPSPLEAAGAPVLQAVLANTSRPAWQASARGLGQADLAMNVVLPELDGRLLTGAISFKEATAERPTPRHAPDRDGIALTAERAAGWARLAGTPRADRDVAVVLSDYPGVAGQRAHAVGLDTLASLSALVRDLRAAGYDLGETSSPAEWSALLCEAAPCPVVSRAAYEAAFGTLPRASRERVLAAWGKVEDDPDFQEGWFRHRVVRLGRLRVAIQPDRGRALDRRDSYHDPDLPPRHGFIAFHLWLSAIEPAHALVQFGAHGTLEWLPGKAVALARECFPAALLGGVPVIYPYIVNDPGEAAAAKRRLGAVTIGHLTPPMARAGLDGDLASLERAIDEYAAADGLDRRRTAMLRRSILDTASELGLAAEAGVPGDAPAEDALARLSAYLCDVKDMQIRDGLHVFGRAPDPARRAGLLGQLGASAGDEAGVAARLDASPPAERSALLDALDGRFVPPGPAGAPTRGRSDVLPTGRNLFAIDPRTMPTRSAVSLAERAAGALLRRHLQDQGDWLRTAVIDLWGSTSLRTGGEDLALALLLLGTRPTWDGASARVSGFEIVPQALLDRPRVDVTLRVSGLFRDAFAAQVELLDQAVRAVARLDEAADWNGLAEEARQGRSLARLYGPAPGTYGAGVAALTDGGDWSARDELGDAYLAASGYAYGIGAEGVADRAGFAARVQVAEAYVHVQDHAETDLLDGPEQASHAGGFAAASARLGSAAALYHADTSRPEAPRLRGLAEEVARVTRGRAANERWIAGMRRHGYRGAAEIARGLEALFVVAATVPARFDAQFELLFRATLADEVTERFLRESNRAARDAMAARFEEAMRRGLWRPRSNSAAAATGAVS